MDEDEERRMRNTFGGYDWGDPIQLWTVQPHRSLFTYEQWAIAERVFGVAAWHRQARQDDLPRPDESTLYRCPKCEGFRLTRNLWGPYNRALLAEFGIGREAA